MEKFTLWLFVSRIHQIVASDVSKHRLHNVRFVDFGPCDGQQYFVTKFAKRPIAETWNDIVSEYN
jgi:hypothetical protein